MGWEIIPGPKQDSRKNVEENPEVKELMELNIDDLKKRLESKEHKENVKSAMSLKGRAGMSMLHRAARSGKDEMVEAILNSQEHKESVAQLLIDKDDYGRVPMHYAAMHGQTGVMKAMLESKEHKESVLCAINTKGKDGCTPSDYAERYSNYGICFAIDVARVNAIKEMKAKEGYAFMLSCITNPYLFSYTKECSVLKSTSMVSVLAFGVAFATSAISMPTAGLVVSSIGLLSICKNYVIDRGSEVELSMLPGIE